MSPTFWIAFVTACLLAVALTVNVWRRERRMRRAMDRVVTVWPKRN